ncbi:unnamed protein product [Symbiodinium microadriaticum]|nr:unnamed protein product [Symbiodinium microadriaticum]
MGWSSWYAFGAEVEPSLRERLFCRKGDQLRMERTFAKLLNRSVQAGSARSLWDAGYRFANIDDGWQACHAGVDGSFHSAEGKPLVNRSKFPDLRAMTSRARAMGLRPGFYMNNYICAEGSPRGGIGGEMYMRNMRGSVEFLHEYGFEYVKIDSGSVYNDLQLWSDLLGAAGSPIAIENCHQGGMEPNVVSL